LYSNVLYCYFGFQVYSQLEGSSHVVNTAWAMMALLAAGYHNIDALPLHKVSRTSWAAALHDIHWGCWIAC
jgi:cycloartenol synthase